MWVLSGSKKDLPALPRLWLSIFFPFLASAGSAGLVCATLLPPGYASLWQQSLEAALQLRGVQVLCSHAVNERNRRMWLQRVHAAAAAFNCC